jgi:Rho-binding antiterminator
MSDLSYTPISCDFHDHLLAYATLRRICAITYTTETGDQVETQDRIVDVYTQSGEEFLKLQGGTVIRLDHLIRVDPAPIQK